MNEKIIIIEKIWNYFIILHFVNHIIEGVTIITHLVITKVNDIENKIFSEILTNHLNTFYMTLIQNFACSCTILGNKQTKYLYI